MATDTRICTNPPPKEVEDQEVPFLLRAWKWCRSRWLIFLLLAIIGFQQLVISEVFIEMHRLAGREAEMLREENQTLETFRERDGRRLQKKIDNLEKEVDRLKKEAEQRK